MKKALVLFFVFLSAWVFSQTPASLHGKVTDAISGETLAGASISVQGIGQLTTDFDGYFDLSSLKPGMYTIVCRYLSYSDKKMEVEVKAGETAFVQIPLEDPLNTMLEGTATTAVSPASITSSKNHSN